MAKSGAYIRDVHLLEELNSEIESSGQSMLSIDTSVVNYLNEVKGKLDSQLEYIQMKLSEARTSLSNAEAALSACQVSQAAAMAAGMMGPSCMMEESAVEIARAEVAKWENRYAQGQQIVDECSRETGEYNGPGGGHALIQNMSGTQTPKASQLLNDCVTKLRNILSTDVGSSTAAGAARIGAAAVAGGAAVLVMNDKFSKFNMGLSQNNNPLLFAKQANDMALAQVFGIEKGDPMTTAEADMQSANPNHKEMYFEDPEGEWYRYNGKMYKDTWLTDLFPETKEMSLVRYRKNDNYAIDEQYGINCATTSAAYVMRKQGWNVVAKGNPEEKDNLNYKISHDPFVVWKNADGTRPTPTLYSDYMKKNHLSKMTSDDYKAFFEEACKEKGIYQVEVLLRGGGHATILQRDDDGLHFIEPQIYEPYYTDNQGRRNIDDLTDRMASWQWSNWGVMRVDDKLFDPKYAGIFEK